VGGQKQCDNDAFVKSENEKVKKAQQKVTNAKSEKKIRDNPVLLAKKRVRKAKAKKG
jgi:hypothetical protein